MASRGKKTPDPGWYSRQEISVIFGVSRSYMTREISSRLPDDATTKIGNKIFWYAPSVYRVLLSRPRSKTLRGANQADPADLALREANAKVAKMESQSRLLELQIEQRKGEWITQREWQQRLSELVKRLRTVGDLIRRRGDKKLHKVFNDSLVRMARDLEIGGSDDAASSS